MLCGMVVVEDTFACGGWFNLIQLHENMEHCPSSSFVLASPHAYFVGSTSCFLMCGPFIMAYVVFSSL